MANTIKDLKEFRTKKRRTRQNKRELEVQRNRKENKKKEDSSVTLGKFMKAKIDSTNESIKGGGMKADRVTEGSGYRNKRGFRKDVEAGKYTQTKDAAYYKSIGLTGKRGDRAVDDFFKPYHKRSDAIKLKSGGRAGYKGGKSVKKKGGCAIKGKSPILR